MWKHGITLCKFFIITGLFLSFLFWFGIPKLKKFLDNDSIVIETVEEAPDKKAWVPAITVCGAHGEAWKYNPREVCNETSGDKLMQCFLNSTLTKEEVFSFIGPDEEEKAHNFSLDITLEYYGSCFTLKNRFRAGSTSETDSFRIHLKLHNSWVFLHDPDFFYLSHKIPPVPSISYQNSEMNIHYRQDIELVKHKKRSTKSSPCKAEENYSFNVCLRNVIQKIAGCRLPWKIRNDENKLDKCATLSQYEEILQFFFHAALDEFKRLSELSGCLPPCTYTEVRKIGDPLVSSEAETAYILTLASTRIKVLTENRYPDFSSLVADIGGTLGLFLGFSFIMVWNSSLSAFAKLREYFTFKRSNGILG